VNDFARAEANGPPWSQDEIIAFECARDAITHYMALIMEAIHAQESMHEPEAAELTHLERELNRCAAARANLSMLDPKNADRVRKEYSDAVKQMISGMK
jgi:hypothetical protein